MAASKGVAEGNIEILLDVGFDLLGIATVVLIVDDRSAVADSC